VTETQPTSESVSLAEELRSTFLFESLTDSQRAWLADRGEVVVLPEGQPVYREGEPAAFFFLLLDGRVRLSRQVQSEELVVAETGQRGVYAGATRAWVGAADEARYGNSLTVLAPSRLFRLPAEEFAAAMQEWFPMAVHLLDGLFLGIRNAEAQTSQRATLLALGQMSAGLTHELNNPAAAGTRAVGQLRERVAGMRSKLATIAGGSLDGALLPRLVRLQEEAVTRATKPPVRSPMEATDAEDELADWLDEQGVAGGYDLAPVLASAGLDPAWGEEVLEAVGEQCLDAAVRWIAYSVDTESLMRELEDATSRISALVGAVKQYTSMDRAPYADVDVPAGLDSTVVMLSHKIGPSISVVRDYEPDLPLVPAYGGELNQVFTNLLDNAADAMGGQGRLLLRARREGEGVRVEVVDDGPGIPTAALDRVFDAFWTTKPAGRGTGLGLDIARRIVEKRHSGRLTVTSRPGETCFAVWLPLRPVLQEAAPPS